MQQTADRMGHPQQLQEMLTFFHTLDFTLIGCSVALDSLKDEFVQWHFATFTHKISDIYAYVHVTPVKSTGSLCNCFLSSKVPSCKATSDARLKCPY